MIPAVLLTPLARYLGVLAVGVVIGWSVNDGWNASTIAGLETRLADEKAAHATDLARIAAEAAKVAQQRQEQARQAQQAVSEAEARRFEDLTNANRELDSLRADLRSGARRMRVATVCRPTRSRGVPSAAAAARVGDAGAGGELPGTTAADLAGLAGRADEVAARLRVLQDYARVVSGAK